jgi:hypothetical protein
MCCNNSNDYTRWFKLNDGRCFRLLWSFSFMPIFSIVFVLLLSCSVVTPPNLVVVVGGVTCPIFPLSHFETKTCYRSKINAHFHVDIENCREQLLFFLQV